MSTLRTQVPRALKPLLAPARYKGAYGGRGGGKSHFFAEDIVLRCYEAQTRVVCVREVQKDLKDSVKQLIIDKIEKLGLGWFYTAVDSEIRGQNGSLIIFRGMQSYNAESIKSLEHYNIAWVEEAQTLSEYSLRMLRPTMRAEGSELWFSWNPRHRTDCVDQFFRKNPPEGAICVRIDYRDNPWFPEVLRKDMLADFAADPVMAAHVWGGEYGVDEGAIIARLVDEAERDGRIHDDVDHDGLIEISSDIGFRDTASWWFWLRRNNGYSLVDYDEDSGLDAEEWIERLQQRLDDRAMALGRVWLPHDARAKTFRSRFTVMERFLSAFGANRCAVVPRTSKTDRINAGRAVIRSCEFHKTRCERGLDGLRAWTYAWDPDKQVFSRDPDHNWASHPSDAFTYGCQVMQLAVVPEEPDARPKWPHEQTADEVFWPANERSETRWV